VFILFISFNLLFTINYLIVIKLYKYIYLAFLYIINILSYNYFIKFYFKNKIILYNVLIFVKIKLKKTRFVIVINNKYLNIISIYYFKFIIIKSNKFLIISN
jgi:hypothetical protein